MIEKTRFKDPDKPKVVEFDRMPEALKKHRTRIREMMQARCSLPDSPIPVAMASRAADWIMMLTVLRAHERMKLGAPAFPDEETLRNDIARAAESVETVVFVMREEAAETKDGLAAISTPGVGGGKGLHLLVPDGEAQRREAERAAIADTERSPLGGIAQAASDPDAEAEGPGVPDGGA